RPTAPLPEVEFSAGCIALELPPVGARLSPFRGRHALLRLAIHAALESLENLDCDTHLTLLGRRVTVSGSDATLSGSAVPVSGSRVTPLAGRVLPSGLTPWPVTQGPVSSTAAAARERIALEISPEDARVSPRRRR